MESRQENEVRSRNIRLALWLAALALAFYVGFIAMTGLT